MPRPHRVGHYAMMTVVCLSVCLSVPCLTISWEWKGVASWKLARRKPMKRMTCDPIYRSRGQRSRSLGLLLLRRNIRQMFGTRRPTDFKVGVWMEYDDPHYRHARWRQRSKVKVITSRRQFDPCLPITRQRNVAYRNIKMGGKVVRATADIAYQFQGQKNKADG